VHALLYLALRRVFELVVLLGRSPQRKEIEILVLRHELGLLRRQAARPRYEVRDRTLLAALSRLLPRTRWSAFAVTPETLLRWHAALLKRRWTYEHRRPGRPRLGRDVVALILRLARENPRWGTRRIVGELRSLGISVSETSVRGVLRREGIPPAPRGTGPSWRDFIHAQAKSILACDFFTVETAFLRRYYVLFFIEIVSRRVHLAGSSPNPSGRWAAQQARNLAHDLDERSQPLRFVIHDRDSKFSAAFDEVFRTEGATVIKTPVRAPNANAYAERWIRTIGTECLDHLLIVGRGQLERVLRTYVDHYNHARPHRALGLDCPNPPPSKPHLLSKESGTHIRRIDRLGGLLHEYARAA
jgi:putative transposase